MQRERRQNPYPFDWQLAALAGIAALITVPVLGLHAARTLANLGAGAGISWPVREEIFTSLPALVRGDATAGLPARVPAAVATPTALWVWSAAMMVALTVLAIWGGTWWWHRHGPGKVLGMATRAEAEELLGRSRLRKHRHVIRPDLYPRRRIADRLVAIATRQQHRQPTTRQAQT